ncbi:uncharacterized protein LOC143188051 [Calliopsis andreniformis]|uniref:uncharacterized protein LOC143188051 n=1 Tax=Calliopsis andreniformis TaxID=337506 RepID=UPI003FCD2313
MPNQCIVAGCKSQSGDAGIAMFSFPKQPSLQEKWLQFVNVDQKLTKNRRICSNHFKAEDIWKKYPRPLLVRNCVPSVNGPINSTIGYNFGIKIKSETSIIDEYIKEESPTISELHLKKEDEGVDESNTDILNSIKFDDVRIHNLTIKSEPIEECQETPSTSNSPNIDLSRTEINCIKFEMQPITEALNTSSMSNSSERTVLDNMQHILNKQAAEIKRLRKKLKKLRDINRKIIKENNRNIYKRKLKKGFTNNQIKALTTNSNRRRHWSDQTIIKALK